MALRKNSIQYSQNSNFHNNLNRRIHDQNIWVYIHHTTVATKDDTTLEHDWNQKHAKIYNFKLSKTISECCELMTSKKLCMWWTNYNDNNYLFSCFYLNNYSTASVFCWIFIYMQTPFFPYHGMKNKYWSLFPYFLCIKFYGSQLQVQDTAN